MTVNASQPGEVLLMGCEYAVEVCEYIQHVHACTIKNTTIIIIYYNKLVCFPVITCTI